MDEYSVWHPLGTISLGANIPEMVCGDRIYLKDERGKKYIDGLCGLWNMSLGYGNNDIIVNVANQLKKIAFVNLCEFRNDTVTELASLLIRSLDADMKKIFFTCTGSESNEVAIKLIRKYQHLKGNTRKRKIGVLSSSYHGSYYGSLSASQFEAKYKIGYEPFLDDFIPFELPFCRCCHSNNISARCLDQMLDRLRNQFDADKIGGVLIEPVVGSGGIIPIPSGYLKELERLCKENDVLFVCDEVATGFGRTGKMFAYQHDSLKPDLVCMGKGINSGYLPLGGVAVNDKIYQVFKEADVPIFHLSTQNGNPVCCSAAIETLHQLENNDYALICNVEAMGMYLMNELWKKIGEHPYVFDIRGKGLMVAIDLVESKVTGEIFTQRHIYLLVERLKKAGLLVEFCYNEGITATISLFFAFIITKEEINLVVDIFKKVFDKIC